MHYLAALISSLACLAIVSTIYYCNIRAHPDSRLCSEVFAMMLLAFLTGLFPLALATSVAGFWDIVTGGLSLASVLSAGVELVSVGATVATIIVFRALVKATYRKSDGGADITPFVPKSPSSGSGNRRVRKAA